MTRLNNYQIKELKKLKTKGVSSIDLSKRFNTSLSTIYYWTTEGYAERHRKKSREKYNNLTKVQKKEIHKKKLPYLKKYMKNKYNTDPEFRKKHIERVMDSRKKRKEKSQIKKE